MLLGSYVRPFTTTFALQKHQPLAPAGQSSILLQTRRTQAAIMVHPALIPTAAVPKVMQPRTAGPKRRRNEKGKGEEAQSEEGGRSLVSCPSLTKHVPFFFPRATPSDDLTWSKAPRASSPSTSSPSEWKMLLKEWGRRIGASGLCIALSIHAIDQ